MLGWMPAGAARLVVATVAKSKTRKVKKSFQPKGHPARAAAADDPLLAKVQHVMGLSVELVRDLREGGYAADSNEITWAMSAAAGWMTVAARMEGVPTPYEMHGWTEHTGVVRGRTYDPPAGDLVESAQEPVEEVVESLSGASMHLAMISQIS